MKILRTEEFEKLKLNLINLKNNNNVNFDHYGEKIKINWRSRKGLDYVDFFYSCCGTRCSSEKKECPRKNWKNPNSYHPGELYLFSSRRLGGGISPFQNIRYHIPICNLRTWNCCNRYSNCEGCHLISEK